jgi:putative peptidoglycan lipid II flippase
MAVTEKLEHDTGPSAQGQVWRAAGIVSAAFVASRLLGLVRDAVIGYYFGAVSIEANAYRIATRLPETIFFIIAGGALGSAFIPTFAAYFARDDAAGGWRLFSAIVNLVLIVLAILSGIVAVFARPFLLLYLPEMAGQPELLTLTTQLLRILLISTVIFGASGVFMGALNARQHFLLPALAPIVYNLGIIGGAVLAGETALFSGNAVVGLGWGTVAGAAGHLLIQVPGLRRHGARYTPVVTLRHSGVRQVITLMAPRVLGLSFSQINNLIIPALATSLLIVAPLDFAWKIVLMPQSILGQALGIAAFPTFATLAAQTALPEMRRILSDTLRLIIFLGLPATILLMILAQPVVALAFQRGAFSAQDTTLTAWALLFFAPGLVALAGLEVVSRAFYALQDTVTPVLAGAVQLVVMALLGLLFSRWLFPALGWATLGGLALGVSLSNLLETGFLLWLLRRKMQGVGGRRLWQGLWRMIAATLAMSVVSWLALQRLLQLAPFWQLLACGGLGALTYGVASWLLQLDELEQSTRLARRVLVR